MALNKLKKSTGARDSGRKCKKSGTKWWAYTVRPFELVELDHLGHVWKKSERKAARSEGCRVSCAVYTVASDYVAGVKQVGRR